MKSLRPLLPLVYLALVSCRSPAPAVADARAENAPDASVEPPLSAEPEPELDAQTPAHDATVPLDSAIDGAIDGADGAPAAAPPAPRPTRWPFAAQARAADIDNDGRADWIASVGERTSPWIEFLARSDSAGTTAIVDDEITRGYLRAQCPGASPPLVLVDSETGDPRSFVKNDEDLMRRTLCMRVWGKSTREVRQWIRSQRSALQRLAAALEPRDGAVEAWIEALDRVAAMTPPLQLRATDPRLPTSWPATDAGAPSAPTDATDDDGDAGAADSGAPAAMFTLRRANARVRRQCARWAAQNQQRVHRALARTPSDHESDEERSANEQADRVAQRLLANQRCVDAEGGAWVIEIVSLTTTFHNDDAPSLTVRWAPRWIGNDGRDARLSPSLTLTELQCDHDELALFGTTDYDNDGRGELVMHRVHYWCGDGDGDDAGPLEVYTARDGSGAADGGDAGAPLSVSAFALPPHVHGVTSARDLDGDGRLDLLDTAWYGETTCDPAAVGTDSDAIWPVPVHARADGSFVYDDAITRGIVARWCEGTPRTFALGENGAFTLGRALCAQYAGWDLDRIFTAVSASGDGYGPVCNDAVWMRGLLLTRSPYAQPIPEAMR